MLFTSPEFLSSAGVEPQFSAHDYVDENHLDRLAARRFSAELGALLAPFLVP